MDKQYFLSAGIPPLHFQPSFSPSPMSTWQPLSSAPPDTTWEKSTQHYAHLESALSSSPNYTCCYTTPMNSPPKLHIPIVKQNSPILTDPEFAQRAAKFSSFGSHSFNDRTSQLGINNTELQYRSNSPLMGIGRLSRISSSPSLKPAGSPMDVQENINSAANSNEDSYIEQIPTELKTQNHSKHKKRKPVPSGKHKELPSNATKEEAEADDDSNAKRSKLTKTSENMKAESNEGQKQGPKPPEPPKDYIHVRARRGQATDSHSLAERVRREKISERMKLLQDLVPGCNKVTGKAPMLDEIINYVQSLQHQVEFLSMKLASVNPSFDFNMDSLLSKDIFQPTGSLPHPSYYPHQPQQNTQGLVDPFQLPPVDGFGEGLPQFPTFFEDDLQSIFQMGFGGNPNRDTALPLHTFPAPNQASSTKN